MTKPVGLRAYLVAALPDLTRDADPTAAVYRHRQPSRQFPAGAIVRVLVHAQLDLGPTMPATRIA